MQVIAGCGASTVTLQISAISAASSVDGPLGERYAQVQPGQPLSGVAEQVKRAEAAMTAIAASSPSTHAKTSSQS